MILRQKHVVNSLMKLAPGHLLKMSMCHDATTRALIEFRALSGAGINEFNVRKEQEIILAGI